MSALKVGIVGLGYVGLSLVRALCDCKTRVYGFDIDSERVNQLSGGVSPNESIPSSEVLHFIQQGLLTVHSEIEVLGICDVVVIAVPTPLTEEGEPDYRPLKAACEDLAKVLRSDALLINESTSHPGTLRDFIKPIISSFREDKGAEILFACSPERVNPGDTIHSIKSTPRVISGIGDAAKSAAGNFYSLFVGNIHVAQTPEIAEMSKLLENSFRLVNIAFINELNDYCLKRDIPIREVISAASTKPFGFMPFQPSAGIGGHCIPVDPEYLLKSAMSESISLPILESAAESNRHQPERIIRFIEEKFGDFRRKNILVTGITYKANIADLRESPAIALMREMRKQGYENLKWIDPLVADFSEFEKGDTNSDVFDLALITVAHDQTEIEKIVKNANRVLDFTGRSNSDGSRVLVY